MSSDRVTDFLISEMPLFKVFSDEGLRLLVEGSRVVAFEPNGAIIRCGEQGRFLGILLEGEAEVTIADDGGEQHPIAVLKKGDVFGEGCELTFERELSQPGLFACKEGVNLIGPKGRVEGRRELIFGDVLVRVHPQFRLAMHIDTNEANAANITTGAIGYINSIQSRG